MRLLLSTAVSSFVLAACTLPSSSAPKTTGNGPVGGSGQAPTLSVAPDCANTMGGLWIHGGCPAEIGSTAAIGAVGLFDSPTSSSCAATRIGRNYLLTAGHCLGSPSDAQKTLLGFVDPAVTTGKQQFAMAKATIVAQILFPKFNGEGANDIGLIVFKAADGTPADPLPSIPVMPIASIFDATGKATVVAGTKLYKAGFGATANSQEAGDGAAVVLNYANLTVKSLDAGNHELQYTDATQGAKAGTCDGDSGGPGFLINGAVAALVGITDRGPTVNGQELSCEQNDGIDEDARYYRKWVMLADQQLQQAALKDLSLSGIASPVLTKELADTSDQLGANTFVVSTTAALALEKACTAKAMVYNLLNGQCAADSEASSGTASSTNASGSNGAGSVAE